MENEYCTIIPAWHPRTIRIERIPTPMTVATSTLWHLKRRPRNKKSKQRLQIGRMLIVALTTAAAAAQSHDLAASEAKWLQADIRPGKLGQWVNPFIGTGGLSWVCGMDSPGATLPLGMVRLSPDTASGPNSRKASSTSGYYYKDSKILGFSHTRLVGTGATDGGNFRVTPVLGSQAAAVRQKKQVNSYSHDAEIAFPGYYAVELPDAGVRCELTATTRVGVHRYTFRKDESPHLLLDVTSVLGGGRTREGELRIRPEAKEVEGAVRSFGNFSGRYGGL
jgi:putative alpha-1,2-mannosidase